VISSLFIRRPRLALVISFVISLAGLLALGAIPVAQFPDIVPPQVQVTATYPGASAAAVEASVAQVIESQVNGVERMIYMKSMSGGDGSYTLNVSFEVGTNPDIAAVNVTNRVNRAVALLPPELQRIGVSVRKQSSALLQVIAVYSPQGTHDKLFLSNYTTIAILDDLRRVPGVGEATPFGSLDYSMRVWLVLDRMASLGITEQDVIKALQSQNVQAAVGRIGAAPMLDDVEFQLNINTQGRLITAEEFENVIVRAAPDGGIVRIKDIARVELGSKTADSVSRYNGREASGIGIYQSPGANALATAQGVRDTMKELATRFPEDLTYDVMYDTTVFVQAMIHKVIVTLFEAFVLVAIVVFIFLGNLRATLIPIIAVPVALIGTLPSCSRSAFPRTPFRCSPLFWPSASWSTMRSWWSKRSSINWRRSRNSVPRRRRKRRWRRSPGRSSRSHWSCCRCSCRRHSSPASLANCTSSSPSPCRFPW
jgi:multidrug efflux pump subunit AcrB